MGIHPKIGITGLPRSGKSAVMEKVLEMLGDERAREIQMRGSLTEAPTLEVCELNQSWKAVNAWDTACSTLSPVKTQLWLTRTSIHVCAF